MDSRMDSARLPLPDIPVFQHFQYKQTHRLRPPKLKRYYHDSNFNRSHSLASASTAHAISFREGISEAETLPLMLSSSADETYFEQSFTRIAKIGEGSFGEVFKVRSREDGLLYAVKMSKELFRSEHYRNERLEEVRRYEQFSEHANCVRFYRAWEQDSTLYMQMELCRESLECYLERRRHIPDEKIWSILLDLLLALKSLHDRNLMHMDIKLDNVLIGDDDSCKLADFGLVIDVDRANRHQATEGDSRYIAPEIMQGKFSKAADIFSLGMAMLELSCYLELPSNGPLWQQLRSGILPEDFIKTISGDLQTVIKQMMTPDPLERPTVDQLLCHKKCLAMLQRRKRWELFKKVKQTIRKSRRAAWSKLCNLKNIVFSFLTCLLTTWRLQLPSQEKYSPRRNDLRFNGRVPSIICTTNMVSSTPTCNDGQSRACIGAFPINDNCFEISQEQGTPLGCFDSKIVNSTPLNHNQQSFRSRKDLTKTSFNFRTVEDSESAVASNPNSFLNLDDIESNSHWLMHKPYDNISLRGKKLFD